MQHLPSGCGLQVQRDAALAAVEGLEVQAGVVGSVRRYVAAHIPTGVRVLDLDHLGAEVGQEQRAEWTGAELFHRDDS